MSITYFFLSVFGTLRFKKGSNWQICSPPFHAKKRINQIIATNRHHSWTATAFGSAKKWRQRRVARDNAFSQSLSSTILEKSLRFTLPGWSFCRALHQFKHDPGFHYSWEILTVHFARMIVLHQFRHDPNHLEPSCIFYGFQRQIVVILNNGLWWRASPVTREHETR